MGKSAIRDIFNGDCGHFETMNHKSPHAQKLSAAVDKAFETLHERMVPEIADYHEQFIDALRLLHAEEVEFFFTEGFKLGIRVGMESAVEEE